MLSNLFIGIVSGVVSSIIVTLFFNHKEKIDRLYKFWLGIIAGIFQREGILFPIDEIDELNPIGGIDSEFGKLYSDICQTYNNGVLNKKLNEQQCKIINDALRMWTILNKWYHKKAK